MSKTKKGKATCTTETIAVTLTPGALKLLASMADGVEQNNEHRLLVALDHLSDKLGGKSGREPNDSEQLIAEVRRVVALEGKSTTLELSHDAFGLLLGIAARIEGSLEYQLGVAMQALAKKLGRGESEADEDFDATTAIVEAVSKAAEEHLKAELGAKEAARAGV